MLDEQLAGVYKHERQIKERQERQERPESRQQSLTSSFAVSYKSESDEIALTNLEVANLAPPI